MSDELAVHFFFSWKSPLPPLPCLLSSVRRVSHFVYTSRYSNALGHPGLWQSLKTKKATAGWRSRNPNKQITCCQFTIIERNMKGSPLTLLRMHYSKFAQAQEYLLPAAKNNTNIIYGTEFCKYLRYTVFLCSIFTRPFFVYFQLFVGSGHINVLIPSQSHLRYVIVLVLG